jgi:heat shock protein HtpX
MVTAVLALTIVLAIFLIGVRSVFYYLLLLLDIPSASLWSLVITGGLVAYIGYLEFRHLDTVERIADAKPVSRETEPELYAMTTNVAALFDVPVPTILVSDRAVPEAMAIGFRPGNIHLVVSRGTIEALDTTELEAVIAHELAHVVNRDAMVMTALSTPVVLADGFRSRLAAIAEDREDHDRAAIVVTVPLMAVSTAVWVVGSVITARLSRHRELAADRAAAQVVGAPSTLATALTKLDAEISESPSRDLREVSGVSSLSILSLKSREPEKLLLGPNGDIEPSYWWLRKRLHRLEHRLLVSHPPTASRLDELAKLERQVG